MITPSMLYSMFKNDFESLPEEKKALYLSNGLLLVAKVSELLSVYGKEPKMTSGWRPKSYNAQIGGSPSSKHLTCQAVDLWDPDKELGLWCTSNVGRLRELKMSMEALEYKDAETGEIKGTHASADPAKRWVHLSSVVPPSGHTIFIP